VRLFFGRKRRTVYSCGNCREQFRTPDALAAHLAPVCPLVAVEREVAAWNARRGYWRLCVEKGASEEQVEES